MTPFSTRCAGVLCAYWYSATRMPNLSSPARDRPSVAAQCCCFGLPHMATINSASAAASPASSTMAGLVPAAHGTAKRPAEQVTLRRSEAPAPGQYWRPRADLPGRHDKRGKHNALKAGTLLLVTTIDLADGVMHSVQLAPHPSWGKYDSGCHIHIDDFELQWEYVPDAEADAIRATEMAGVTTAMAETQEALIQGPPPAEATGFARLEHTPLPMPATAPPSPPSKGFAHSPITPTRCSARPSALSNGSVRTPPPSAPTPAPSRATTASTVSLRWHGPKRHSTRRHASGRQ